MIVLYGMKKQSYYTSFTLFFFISLLLALGIFTTSASAIQPTQVIADIPQEYNEVFSLQWGGGSLYQLKQRLATMSCIVDTIWAVSYTHLTLPTICSV